MLALTHVAIGAAIGEQLPPPWLAFPVALISHLLLDKIPHFFSFQKKIKKTIILSDSIATAGLLLILFFLPTKNHNSLLAGAVGGLIIDLVLVIILQEKGRIANWHTTRQIHKENYWWLATDVVIFTIGILLIMVLR